LSWHRFGGFSLLHSWDYRCVPLCPSVESNTSVSNKCIRGKEKMKECWGKEKEETMESCKSDSCPPEILYKNSPEICSSHHKVMFH
uniref:Uncharacterized protein n=1 Tax=Phasianus colchicus TaxID=9054 RepID=A0A669QT38_PHACC